MPAIDEIPRYRNTPRQTATGMFSITGTAMVQQPVQTENIYKEI